MVQQTKELQPEILLVDDEKDICQMLADALVHSKCRCTLVSQGQEACDLIKENRFDLVVSDIALKDLTGLEILEHVNAHCPGVRTVLMTGHRRREWSQRALDLGAFDYLEKPFEIDDFLEVVRRALTHQPNRDILSDALVSDTHKGFSMVLETDGSIQYVSEGFSQIVGIDGKHAVSTDFDTLWAGEGLSFTALMKEVRLSGKATVQLTRADGRPFHAQLGIREVTMKDDRVIYLVGVLDMDHAARQNTPRAGNAILDGYDDLTGLPGHNGFQNELDRLHTLCRRYGRHASLLLLAVGNMHQINDRHGFKTGNAILRHVGQNLRKSCRVVDFIARFSGKTFGLLLPETSGQQAMTLAERLAEQAASMAVELGKDRIAPRLYAGLAEHSRGFAGSSVEWVRRGTEALGYALSHDDQPVVLWQPMMELTARPGNVEDSATGLPGDLDRQLHNAYLEMTLSLVAAVEAKDPYTRDHSLNVADYAEWFAGMMHLDESEIRTIRCAATLHDVGKIGIPDAILTKPGALTAEEFQVIREHPTLGANILRQSSFLEKEVPLVLEHHERFDGKGYPQGLRGSDMSLGSRILQVADAMDAMISCRSYKAGFRISRVQEILDDCRGTQFDPDVVEVALSFLDHYPEKIHFSPMM